jgi:hypothetical protein
MEATRMPCVVASWASTGCVSGAGPATAALTRYESDGKPWVVHVPVSTCHDGNRLHARKRASASPHEVLCCGCIDSFQCIWSCYLQQDGKTQPHMPTRLVQTSFHRVTALRGSLDHARRASCGLAPDRPPGPYAMNAETAALVTRHWCGASSSSRRERRFSPEVGDPIVGDDQAASPARLGAGPAYATAAAPDGGARERRVDRRRRGAHAVAQPGAGQAPHSPVREAPAAMTSPGW